MVILVHEGGMQDEGDPHEPGSGHKAIPFKEHPNETKSKLVQPLYSKIKTN